MRRLFRKGNKGTRDVNFAQMRNCLIKKFGRERTDSVLEKLMENATKRAGALRLLEFQRLDTKKETRRINRVHERKAKKIINELTGGEGKIFWGSVRAFLYSGMVFGGLSSNEYMLHVGLQGIVAGAIVGGILSGGKRLYTLPTEIKTRRMWNHFKDKVGGGEIE